MSRRGRSSIHRFAPEPVRLSVIHGPYGRLRVVDQYGVPLLSHPDPLEHLRRAYVARACYELRQAVAPLIWRLERIEVDHGIPVMARTDKQIASAWLSLHESEPPYEDLKRALDREGQQELLLEDDAA